MAWLTGVFTQQPGTVWYGLNGQVLSAKDQVYIEVTDGVGGSLSIEKIIVSRHPGTGIGLYTYSVGVKVASSAMAFRIRGKEIT